MSDTNRVPIKVVPRWQYMNYADSKTLEIVQYLPFCYGYHNDTC